jgi:hypothetical protein
MFKLGKGKPKTYMGQPISMCPSEFEAMCNQAYQAQSQLPPEQQQVCQQQQAIQIPLPYPPNMNMNMNMNTNMNMNWSPACGRLPYAGNGGFY